MGLEQDKQKGFGLFIRAYDEGSADTISGFMAYRLGVCYELGDGVGKDIDKALHYFKVAAELGHLGSFSRLGSFYFDKGEMKEAMINFRKAAVCGLGDSVLNKNLRTGYIQGFLTKEEYEATLRSNQAAAEEVKTEAREEWKRRVEIQQSLLVNPDETLKG